MDLEASKRIVADLIKVGGGYDAAASWMGVSKSYLHNLQNRHEKDDPREKSLAWWIQLEEFAGRPLFREALALDAGYVMLSSECKADAEVRDALMNVCAAVGKVTYDTDQALSDGVIDAAEDKTIRDGLRPAISNIHILTEALNKARRAKS